MDLSEYKHDVTIKSNGKSLSFKLHSQYAINILKQQPQSIQNKFILVGNSYINYNIPIEKKQQLKNFCRKNKLKYFNIN